MRSALRAIFLSGAFRRQGVFSPVDELDSRAVAAKYTNFSLGCLSEN